MKILETLENLNIIDNNHYENYMLELKKIGEKFFNKAMKNYVVFETDDKINLAVNFEYYDISKIILYNHKAECPEITEDFFVEYNMRNNQKEILYKKSLFFASYKNPKAIYIVPAGELKEYGGYYDKIRELSSDETYFIQKVAKEKDEIFIKKLRAFYKRYKDKIYCDEYDSYR